MTHNIQIVSLIIGIMAGTIGSAKDYIFTSLSNKARRILFLVSFLFILSSAMFSIVSVNLQKDQELTDKNEKLEQYQTTLRNADSILKKSDITIGKLNLAFDSLRSLQFITNLIVDSLDTELQLQQEVIKSSRNLLSDNQNLLANQKETYQHIDRLLNPLFPLDITIDLEASLDKETEASLLKFLIELDINYKSDSNYSVPGAHAIRLKNENNKYYGFVIHNIRKFKENLPKNYKGCLQVSSISLEIFTKSIQDRNNIGSSESILSFAISSQPDITFDLIRKKAHLFFSVNKFSPSEITYPRFVNNTGYNEIEGKFIMVGFSDIGGSLGLKNLLLGSTGRREYRILAEEKNRVNPSILDWAGSNFYIIQIPKWYIRWP